ncbi:MAG: GNAT family N-acetyltransferase [Bacteroidota bacterium]
MPLTPVIRPVRPSDLDALVVLCAAHAAYEGAPYRGRGKAEALKDLLFGASPSLLGLVVERDEALVGFATWSVQLSTWDAAPYAHLDCLYLDPAARGRGLGRDLVATVARDARRAGCTQVQWQTPASNHRAIRFYERLGATAKPKVRFYLDEAALRRLTSDPSASYA